MRTSRTITLFLALAALATAALTASAAPRRTAWTRISGPAQPGEQLGLARTPDGVLHVIWNRGVTPTSIFETRLSPAGRAIGTSTVATGFDGNGGLALLVMPDRTLRLFASGAIRPGSPAYGINTFVAPASGETWSLQSGAYWGGAVANASPVIGATLTKDGRPVTAWRGTAAVGVPPSSIQGYEGGMTESQLATDGAGGAVVLSGVTNAGQGGVYVQQVLPSLGARTILPLPFSLNDWNPSLSGRLGAPGVYVAYADGKAVRLYRYGGGTKTLGRGAFTSAAACPGPGGRLWVAWGGPTSGLFVTRSSMSASAFEPVQRLALPQNGGDGLFFLQCEGSAGPVDVFADVPGAPAQGFWQTHVLARFTLRAHAKKTRVTLSVLDAGDPVPGAVVTIGRKHLTTGANGLAVATLRPGSYSARATVGGYAPVSIRFSVR